MTPPIKHTATDPVEVLEAPIKHMARARALINANEEDSALAVCHSCRTLCRKQRGKGFLGRGGQGEREFDLGDVSGGLVLGVRSDLRVAEIDTF